MEKTTECHDVITKERLLHDLKRISEAINLLINDLDKLHIETFAKHKEEKCPNC